MGKFIFKIINFILLNYYFTHKLLDVNKFSYNVCIRCHCTIFPYCICNYTFSYWLCKVRLYLKMVIR